MAQGDLEIQHEDTDNTWADVNTKTTQRKRFRVMRGEVVGVFVEHKYDVERRRTHPLLIPKVESEQIFAADGEILEKAAIVAPIRSFAKNPTKVILRGGGSKSISPRVKPTANRRSVLEEDKYAPVSGSKWKHVSARFPTLYKALLAELNVAVSSSMLKTAVHLAG